MPAPIGELCRDPRITRARAARREPVPCYRCIAWTGSRCELLDAARWRSTPAPEADQTTLFPTSDEAATVVNPKEP